MKKIIAFLYIISIFSSCTSTKEQEIDFFNGIKFKLYNHEVVTTVDAKKKALFDAQFDRVSMQIPIFKCIKADDYLMFLGLPIDTSIKELTDYSLKYLDDEVAFESDTTSFFYIKNQKENTYIYSEDFNGNLIYVLMISESSEIPDSLFSKAAFSKRFNKIKL